MNPLIASAFFIVLLLVIILLWNMIFPKNATWSKKGHHRLSVLETKALDPKRRLILVMCDGEQHLLMVGGPNDLVVHSKTLEAERAMREEPSFMANTPFQPIVRDALRP